MIHYIIKGDINGIQEFIFNIKSKKAARALKARSYRIEMLGWLAEEKVKQTFNGSTSIYNGGGNFYLKVPERSWDEHKFKDLQADMLKELPKYGILSLTLSCVEYNDSEQNSYGEKIEALNTKANRGKLNRYACAKDPLSFFLPFANETKDTEDEQEEFVRFTNRLVRNKSYEIVPYFEQKNNISSLFGKQVELSERHPNSQKEKIYSHVPLWNDDKIRRFRHIIENRKKADPLEFEEPREKMILEFEYLADFAKERTGTDKLGILKLDVDNLGALFIKVGNEENNQTLSEYFTKFFTTELEQLLNEKFEYKTRAQTTRGIEQEPKEKEVANITERKGKSTIKYYEYAKDVQAVFRENLYVVFAGGDDSFIIGGWDAVIEFALRLHQRFVSFEANLRAKELDFLTDPITLSAAVVVVDAHYPVVKFAELAEGELRKAKTYNSNNKNTTASDASGKPIKDSIAFLGQVFRWKNFNEEVVSVKEKMLEMIVKYDAPKAFVQRN